MTGSRAYRIPLLLALLCALLGWFVWNQLRSPEPGKAGSAAAKSTVAAAEVPELPPPPVFKMRPKEDFIAIIERPIFIQSRRPVVNAPSAAPVRQTRQELDVTLKGVIITDTESLVLLSRGDGEEDISLAVGDHLNGWTLSKVQSNKAFFDRDGEEAVLSLVFDVAPAQNRERESRSERRKRRLQEQEAQARNQDEDDFEDEQDPDD